MTTPGVGPVVALTYRATFDVPARFRKSKSVGAVFRLTCSKINRARSIGGRISCCGDEMMRVMLYEAAQSMLHSKKWVLAQGLSLRRNSLFQHNPCGRGLPESMRCIPFA
jgi:transposase